jgi:uncharacterized damage-inducible protein DinB
MGQVLESLLGEMEQEAGATRRTLERVPGDKLDWRPHEKSMPLGQLARHVATIPGTWAQILSRDSMDVGELERTPEAGSSDELLPLLDECLATAKEIMTGMDDQRATGTWTLLAGDQKVVEAPRVACFRMYALNHWYHHRAQLGVYLRLLDVPVPSVYGPSADDNPLAERIAAAQGGAS